MSTSVSPDPSASEQPRRRLLPAGRSWSSAGWRKGGSLGWLGWIVIGFPAAVLAAGWAVIMAHIGQTPGISAETITYSVLDDSSVQIRYAVAKPKGDAVRCVVDAYDTDFAVVAQREITVPAGTSEITGSETLQTSRRATGARVKDCRKV
jgi:hypothetical protein